MVQTIQDLLVNVFKNDPRIDVYPECKTSTLGSTSFKPDTFLFVVASQS
jgi:hypothetical protein